MSNEAYTETLKKAVDTYNETRNCAQAVFSAFALKYGLSEDIAMRVASGFSGGMRNAEICGAVSGAVMAISLAKGGGSKNHDNSACYAEADSFTKRFKAKNGSIVCRDLLKTDIFVGNNMKEAADKGLFSEVCPKMVEDAVSILLEMGY